MIYQPTKCDDSKINGTMAAIALALDIVDAQVQPAHHVDLSTFRGEGTREVTEILQRETRRSRCGALSWRGDGGRTVHQQICQLDNDQLINAG